MRKCNEKRRRGSRWLRFSFTTTERTECTECTEDNKKVFFTSPRWGKSNKSYCERSTLSERASLLTIHHDMPVNWRVILYRFSRISHLDIRSFSPCLFSFSYTSIPPLHSTLSRFPIFSVISSLSCLGDSSSPANVLCVGYSICSRRKSALDFSLFDTVCVSCPLCWRRHKTGKVWKDYFDHINVNEGETERVQLEDRRERQSTRQLGRNESRGKRKLNVRFSSSRLSSIRFEVSLHKSRYDLLLLIKTSVDEK